MMKKKSRIYIIWLVNLCLITAVVAFFVWYESVPDVLVYAVMQFPFCIFTLQGFMSAVPRDYEESARIDGATNIQLLSRVMVPLAKPGIATITMLSAMGFWNEYPLALVLLTEDAKKTLPIGMANLFEVQKYATDWGALFAGLVIIMIPTIIIYLIGQRYLLQGIGAGGLKG